MIQGSNIIRGLISIIVPVYNGEAWLGRCVQSIQAQTFTMWELLLIDGGSSDRTPALCEAWRERDGRIRVFRSEKNEGVSHGRNKGLREAAGEYLFFADADDWLQPDCLSRLYDEIQEAGVQIAGCGFERCSDRDWEEAHKPPERNYHRKLIAGKDFLTEGILKQDTRCWGKLYRRELLKDIYFREDYTIGEDMLFLLEAAEKAETISSSGYPGYCYYYNVNGAMLRPFRASDMDQIRCWQFVLEKIRAADEAARARETGTAYGASDATSAGMPYGLEIQQKAAAILLVSCMLTVGKYSVLPFGERKQYAGFKKQFRRVIKETLQIEGAYDGLDRGYRLKVALYRRFPNLYIGLYGLMKKLGKR